MILWGSFRNLVAFRLSLLLPSLLQHFDPSKHTDDQTYTVYHNMLRGNRYSSGLKRLISGRVYAR